MNGMKKFQTTAETTVGRDKLSRDSLNYFHSKKLGDV